VFSQQIDPAFVSARLGCIRTNPWGALNLAALCLND
jgi:hypothetical protein